MNNRNYSKQPQAARPRDPDKIRIRCTYINARGEEFTLQFMTRDEARKTWQPGYTPPFIRVCEHPREGLCRFLMSAPLYQVFIEEIEI